jgi:hypothetical protein
VVLFTFSHRITSDIEDPPMAPFYSINHHPRFQGSSFSFIFLFSFYSSLFGLYAPPSSQPGAISSRSSTPPVWSLVGCCGDTTQLLSPTVIYFYRSHLPDSLDERVFPLQVPVPCRQGSYPLCRHSQILNSTSELALQYYVTIILRRPQ